MVAVLEIEEEVGNYCVVLLEKLANKPIKID